MPLLFRKINLKKWVACVGPYSSDTAVPADPISDFATKNNELSLWKVDDDRSNLPRIVAAFATTMSAVSQLEFALVPLNKIVEAGFEIDTTVPGESADARANAEFHCDLVHLTGVHLVKLARIIVNEQCVEEFWPQTDVVNAVRESVTAGLIDVSRLNRPLRTAISV